MSFVAGFFFAFRLIITVLSVRVLGTDPQTGAALSLGLNFSLLAIVGFYALGDRHYRLRDMVQLWSIRWVLFFVCFSGCSLLWSSAASMPAAIAYWSAMVADVAIVVLLAGIDPVEKVAYALMHGFVWGACCVALIAWSLPAQSDLRLGDEELLGPNQIGYLCALALLFAQYRISRNEGSAGVAPLLLGITLVRSLSKTTIIALLLSESFLLTRDRSMRGKTKLLLAGTAVCILAVFWSLFVAYYDTYTTMGNQAETLSGRIGIWAVILEKALEKPWTGHGFHSVWKVIPSFGEFEARHAHNELLQQFYAYGVVGVAMVAGLYGSLYRHLRTLRAGALKTFVVGVLILVVVRGLADTEAFDLSLPLWSIVLISLVVECERMRSEVGERIVVS